MSRRRTSSTDASQHLVPSQQGGRREIRQRLDPTREHGQQRSVQIGRLDAAASSDDGQNPNFHDAARRRSSTKSFYYPRKIFPRSSSGSVRDEPRCHQRGAERSGPDHQKDFKAEFHNEPYLGTYYYVINLTREPLGKVAAVREALTLAINRDVIVEQITRRRARSRPIPGCRRGCRAIEQQTRRLRRTWGNRHEREALAKKLYKGGRVRPRQAAEGRDPLQHQREPQEDRDRGPGHVEAGAGRRCRR